MDANHEKKAIAKQNEKWLTRKKAKSNLQKGHPWLSSDPTGIRKKEKIWKDFNSIEIRDPKMDF